MSPTVWLLMFGTGALSFMLVGAIRRMALNRNLLDVPNERSSHVAATPRGGGGGIAIAFAFALCGLWAIGWISASIWLALVVCGGAIACIGYLDDRYQVRSSIRFMVHSGSAILFVILMGGYPPAGLQGWGIYNVWGGFVFSALVLVWGTNLFNFMDGIDGIAASESIFIAVSGAILSALSGGSPEMTAMMIAVAAASLGFLCWNWPPARIFMGDVGSGFLGFIMSAVLMLASFKGDLPIEILPILGGVFLVDATTTLFTRILQGDRWLEPHRTHAYQRLARGLGGHRPVTLIILAVNVLWLLPWAFATTRFPENGRLFAAAALLPLVIISIAIGAGRREKAPAKT